MNKYIILLTILLTHQGFGTNAVKKLYPDPPQKISMNAINQSITEFNENVDIANTRKYEIQKVRVFFLSLSPLAVHGFYRLIKNAGNEDASAGALVGSTLELCAGIIFLSNGTNLKNNLMRHEEYMRREAVDKCLNLYNNISSTPVDKIREIKPN